MFSNWTLLLLTSFSPLASPPKLPVASFRTGDEMVYSGEVHEESSRISLPYQRKHRVEVRVFVLNTAPAYTDLAVLTSLQVKEDPNVASAAVTVTGQELRASRTPAIRLDLLRIDPHGQLLHLVPKPGTPLMFNDKTETKPLLPVPLDGPATSEFGFYLPRPSDGVASDSIWKTQEKARPDTVWSIRQTSIRNGTQVLELAGEQQTAKWENPIGTDDSWRRKDACSLATSDGLTRQFSRIVERKEGVRVVEKRTVTCELTTPPSPNRGEGYNAIHKEIEAALNFASDWETGRRTRLVERIDNFTQRYRETPYRAAIEAVRRRASAGK